MSQLLREFLEEKHPNLTDKQRAETRVYFIQCPHCHLSTWFVDSDEIENTCDRCCKKIDEHWTKLESGYFTTPSLFWKNKTEPFLTCIKI